MCLLLSSIVGEGSKNTSATRRHVKQDTPEDYQAPGFIRAEGTDHIGDTFEDAAWCGTVKTPFHTLEARSYVHVTDAETASHEALPSENPPFLEDTQGGDDVQPDASLTVDLYGDDKTGDPPVRCSCRRSDDGSPLLTCIYCKTQQHATCYGILREHVTLVRAHCCVNCYDAEPTRAVTDTKLAPLPVRRRECFSNVRRALLYCSERKSFTPKDLMEWLDISEANVLKLIKLLASLDVVPSKDYVLLSSIKINSDYTKTAILKYFQNPEEDGVVEMLMAESLSQEEATDPVGNVLSPLEKMEIHKDSKFAEIIETSTLDKENINTNATLQQYREAVLSDGKNGEDQTPLGGKQDPMEGVKGYRKRKLNNGSEVRPLRTRLRGETKRAKIMKNMDV